MYLNILHVFYTYPKGVQDTFEIDVSYIKIHVSCALPWCHTGYISRYIRIHVSWTLHQDTSRYTGNQPHAGARKAGLGERLGNATAQGELGNEPTDRSGKQ